MSPVRQGPRRLMRFFGVAGVTMGLGLASLTLAVSSNATTSSTTTSVQPSGHDGGCDDNKDQVTRVATSTTTHTKPTKPSEPCEPEHPTRKVEAKPPATHDECGTEHDTYTIPEVKGVLYLVNGKPAKAGTYRANGKVVVVKAVALKGYELKHGKALWELCFTDKPCKPKPTKVTPAEPTEHDECGTRKDTYTIPDSKDVVYVVNHKFAHAGTYPAPAGSKLVVKAYPANKHVRLEGKRVWILHWTNKPCKPDYPHPTKVMPAPPTSHDECGTQHDSFTVPATPGVIYKVDGVFYLKPAKTYPTNGAMQVTIKAYPAKGYKFPHDAVTSWTLVWTNSDCPKPPTTPPPTTKPPVKTVPTQPAHVSHPPATSHDVPVVNNNDSDDRGFVADTGADNNNGDRNTLLMGGALVLFLGGGGMMFASRKRGAHQA